ncbi:efflux RND transporter permease subunit [Bradyrhizobium sp. KB893862 SZCCT0404]|uniref:efflux RND transporter permease subunit n=1 Tax=Bradyrhizobium sp. KB893862 SZCCT0404 TaxID=2807672 RepID=UPI001BACBA30|nr:efflux RND transporter permease subunit [Bradyrhizobium sp. KB893862 SZCCT0404]MBR1180158.1 efflux RND transporter permease subunit [Bradyrhizobium sp. KB893862 SZCCT0404]
MALNISAWSIRHPLPSVVFSIILLVLGWTSFVKLAVTRLPSADIPVISVAVSQFGAAPAELESQVTKTIEDAVSGVEGVRHITSQITDGLSLTTIQFALETNTDRALNDVKDAVTRVRSNLPQNVTEPLIQRVDVIGLPIVTYAAISPGKTPEQLSYFVDDVVKRALQGVRGVAQVERIGGVEREILVSLDPDRLQAMGLTAVNVSQSLRGTNVDVAGGRAEIGKNDQAIRTLAGAKTLGDLAGTMVPLFGGGEVRLDDLGTVTDTIADRRTFARFNGEPVVALGIKRSKGASDVKVAAAVQKRIDALKAAYPDVDLKLIDTSVEYTNGNYEAAISTLFEGAILAVVIVLLFLRDLRATIIAAISLPLSIFPAFWAMDLLGFSLNLVSFLAITLSTGILVDDAIVEIENIVRHMNMGKSPYRAALEAADEIGLAVIAISLTIIAIFAPASFMSGIAGQFFKQFGITVSVQVFFSLLAARFVTPVLAAYFLKHGHHEEPPPGRVLRSYHRIVAWSVKHYFITVLIGFGIFAASIWSITLLPQGFLPAQDSARSLLALELPPGTQLAYTEKVTEDIVARLRKRPEVKSIFVDGGRVPPGTQEVRRAALIINYKPKADRDITQRELEFSISQELENIPDIRFWFLDENGLRAISLVVTGVDANIVNNVASELATQMKRIPTISNVISETTLERPELRIEPRADLAARLGVSTESLSQTIRVATIGDVGPALAKFDVGDRLVPIRVQLEDAARGNLKTLEQLRVPLGERGEKGGVPLSVIADVKLDQGPTSINRYDRERQATVAADLVGSAALGDATKKIYDLPVMKTLPKSVKVSPSGDAESLNELSDGFATAITAGLMMVYAVLVLLFGTFLQPITILFSLPLSIGGAIAALLITGKQLTTPVWIGILMLMGIVTKNAIMLVEFAIEAIRDGKPREDAMIDAGMKRARPIVMTTIAMAAGMMPSALAVGAGGEFRSPMALAVIGGLIFSTILSLVFVPAMFMVMDDLGALIWRFGKRFIVHSEDAEADGHHGASDAGAPPVSKNMVHPAAE